MEQIKQEFNKKLNFFFGIAIGGLFFTAVIFAVLNNNISDEIEKIRMGDVYAGSIDADKLADDVFTTVEFELSDGTIAKAKIITASQEEQSDDTTDGPVAKFLIELEDGRTITAYLQSSTDPLDIDYTSFSEETIATLIKEELENMDLSDTTNTVITIGLTEEMVTSLHIQNSTITNSDISNSAGIGWGKVSKSGATVSELSNDVGYLTSYTETDPLSLKILNNLSDLSNVSTARTNLGLISGGSGDIWVDTVGDTMTGALNINVPTATSSALILQTTDDDATNNLFEVQGSSGGVLSAFSSSGMLGIETSPNINASLTVAKKTYLGTQDTDTDGDSDVVLFGNADGTAAHPGSGDNKLILYGHAGQSRSISMYYDAGNAIWNGSTAGNGYLEITSNYNIYLHPGASSGVGIDEVLPGARLQITIPAANKIGQIIKAAPSQTANLTEWQNSSGTILHVIDNIGRTGIGVENPGNTLEIKSLGDGMSAIRINQFSATATADPLLINNVFGSAGFQITSDSNLILNAAGITGGGNVSTFSKVDSDTLVDIYTARLDRGGGNGGAGLALGYSYTLENGSGNRVLVGRYKYAWGDPTDSDETSIFTIQNINSGSLDDVLTINGSLVGVNETNPGAQLQVTAESASTIGQIIKAAASQTANLTEWQDSGGTPLTSISEIGGIESDITTSSTTIKQIHDFKVTRSGVLTDSDVYGINYEVDFTGANTANRTLIGVRNLALANFDNTTPDVIAMENRAAIGSADTSVGDLVANEQLVATFSTGSTITQAIGTRTRIQVTKAGSTIIDAKNILIRTPTITDGSITNLYGLYVEDQSGADTLNYAIYTNAGDIRFGDTTKIEVATATNEALILQTTDDDATNNLFETHTSAGITNFRINKSGQIDIAADGVSTATAIRIDGTVIMGMASAVTFPSSGGYSRFSGDGMIWTARNNNDISMHIDATNHRVGIGSESNTQFTAGAKLHVKGQTTTEITSIFQAAAAQTANLTEWQDSSGGVLARLTSDGRLGIGIDPVSGRQIHISNEGASSQFQADTYFDNTGGSTFSMRKARGTLAVPQAVQDGDDIFTIFGSSFNTTFSTSGSIKMQVDGVPGAGRVPGRITFLTAASGGSNTERMRINSSGNVLVNGFTSSTVGLTIKAAASQTANLTEWQDNSGTPLVTIEEDGRVLIGSVIEGINLLTNNQGAFLSVVEATGNQKGIYAVQGRHRYESATDNTQTGKDSIKALTGRFEYAGSGDITEAHIFENSGLMEGSAGTLTSLMINYLTDTAVNAGTLVNQYGLYVDDLTSATNNYAILTNAGNIVFNDGGDADTDFRVAGDTDANLFFTDASADMVGIGTNAPGANLDITNTAGATGTTFLQVSGNTYNANGMVILDNTRSSGVANVLSLDTGVSDSGSYLINATSNNGSNNIFYVRTDGNVGIGTNSPTELLDINSDSIRIRASKTPASAADTCDQGEISWDADYIYVCIATDTWERTQLSTW